MVTIRELEYLLALKRYKSFSKAAKALFVSQPSLSIAIKKLEERYNTVLINRHPNSQISFTDVANEVLEIAEKIIQYQNDIEHLLQAQAPVKKINMLSKKITLHVNEFMLESAYNCLLKKDHSIDLLNIDTVGLRGDSYTDVLKSDTDIILDICQIGQELPANLSSLIIDVSPVFICASKETVKRFKLNYIHNFSDLLYRNDFKELSLVLPYIEEGNFAKYIRSRLEKKYTGTIYYISTSFSHFKLLNSSSVFSITLYFSKIPALYEYKSDQLIYIPLEEFSSPFAAQLIYSDKTNKEALDYLYSIFY